MATMTTHALLGHLQSAAEWLEEGQREEALAHLRHICEAGMLARELEAPMSRLHGQSPTGPVIMQLRGLIAQLRPGQELFEDIQTLDTLPGDERTDDWISQERDRDALAQDFSRELRAASPAHDGEQMPHASASTDPDDPVAALEAMFASFGSGEPEAAPPSSSRAAPPLSFGFEAQDEDPASLDQIPEELGAERSWAPREGSAEDYKHDAAALEAMFSDLDAPSGAPQQTSDELVEQAEQAEHASSPGSSRQDDWFEDGFSFVTPETAAPAAAEPAHAADSASLDASSDASGDEDDFEFRLDPPSGDELKLDFGLDLDDEPPSRPDSRELSAPREGSGERWLDRDALLSNEQDAAARAAEATRLPGVNDLQFDLSAPAEPTPAASADFDDLAALLNAPPPEAEDEAAPGLAFDMGSVTGESLPEHLSEPKPAQAGSGELMLELDLDFDDPAPDPLANDDPATFNAEHDEALQAALAASSQPGVQPSDEEDEELDFDLGFSAAPPPRDDVEFDLDFKPPAVEKPVGEEGSPWPFELPGLGAPPEADAAPAPEAPAAEDDEAARLARHEQPTTEAPALDLFMRFNDEEDANQEGQVPSSGPFRWPTEDAPDAGFTRQATPAKDESVHDALLQLSSMGRQPSPEEDSGGEVPEDEFFALAEELASEASRSHYRGEPIGYRGESNPFLLDTPTGISEVDPRVVDPKQYMDATPPPPAPAAPEPSFVLEELPPPPPIPDEKTTAERAREAYNAGELDLAEELARQALAEDASNEDAQRLMNQVESERERQALAKLGSLYETPVLKVSMGEVMGMNLDSRAGYMISQIDGMISFEDLLDLSAMERLETLTLLADLLDRGVIGLD